MPVNRFQGAVSDLFDEAFLARCSPIAKLMFEKLQQLLLMGVTFHLVAHGGDVLAKPQTLAAFRYPSLGSSAPLQELVVIVAQVQLHWGYLRNIGQKHQRIQAYDISV